VKAVVTSDDLPDLPSGIVPMGELPMNPRHLSLNVLARGKVLYDGHAVAAVAATSPLSRRKRLNSSKSTTKSCRIIAMSLTR
jgi:CO/xanthine dehydrogenase Mo-binding subunit